MVNFKDRKPYQHLYDARWTKYSRAFLRRNPLCVYCSQVKKTTPAQVTDHIKPHKGNITLFWMHSNHQSLCKACHDGPKALEESRGYRVGCDVNGLPLDGEHRWNEE